MTEEEKRVALINDKSQELDKPTFPKGDWFLSELMKYTNIGVGFDLILTVSGQTVVGRSISAEMYFKNMSNNFLSSRRTVSVDHQEILELMSKMCEKYTVIGKIPENAPDDFELPLPNYIHLENAKIIGEERDIPSGSGILWRGRLSEVSGFSIGVMTRSE